MTLHFKNQAKKKEDTKTGSKKETLSNTKSSVPSTSKSNVKDNKDKTSTATNKNGKPKYTGPRTVKVYGRELFIEENPKITLEVIRKKLVDEYDYEEFTKEKTYWTEYENGLIVPNVKQEKKG